MQFEYYVLKYNPNRRYVENFNIFRNIYVQKYTEKAIKKYLRNPKKYKYEYSSIYYKQVLYGFEALCEEIKYIIKWQEWDRIEYEILVGGVFEQDCNNLQKLDCYKQCEANIEIITRECIYQYKKQLKEKNNV